MIDRMMRALRLDASVFREVADDSGAMAQMALVVVVTGVLAGIGSFISSLLGGASGLAALAGMTGQQMTVPAGGFTDIITMPIGYLIGWVVWTAIALLLSKLFGGTGGYGMLFRATGLSFTPAALNVLQFIPFLGGLISLIAIILGLITSVLAVREGARIGTGGAIAVVLIPLVIVVILCAILFATVGLAIMGIAAGTSM